MFRVIITLSFLYSYLCWISEGWSFSMVLLNLSGWDLDPAADDMFRLRAGRDWDDGHWAKLGAGEDGKGQGQNVGHQRSKPHNFGYPTPKVDVRQYSKFKNRKIQKSKMKVTASLLNSAFLFKHQIINSKGWQKGEDWRFS